MLNNGGGGDQGGFPGAFMGACLDCAGQNVDAAIQLGVYAACNAAKQLTGQVGSTIIDLTGCGEMPQTCGNALQGLATGLGNQLGKPVQVLCTPAEVEAYKKKLGDTKPAR